MRVAVSSDERTGIADVVVAELRERGHEPLLHGALSEEQRDDWAWASESAARDVAEGRAEQGIVCCWTGTGASIAANKVRGVRAALCNELYTARMARAHNDANVLSLGARVIGAGLAEEILHTFLSTEFEGGRHARRVAMLTDLEAEF
jgi:ribose 5-phosphate isomerase B